MSANHHIKAVLFDLDGTLRHHLPTGSEVFIQYLHGIGHAFSEEAQTRAARWEHFYFAHSLEIQKDGQTYAGDEKGFWVNYSRRKMVALGMHPAKAAELAPDVSAHMGENYKPEVYIPEEAPLVLATLKQAGYKLGVVSNRDVPFHEELKRLNLDAFFEFSLAGGEVQSFKPDRRIFERGLELAGTAPQETMYIGDNYYADIVGSLRVGIMPVLYDPTSLFPDADSECAVIRSFDQLHDLLK